MTTELFNIPECKSPRLLWIERHGIKTEFVPASIANEAAWFAWSEKQGSDMWDALENGGEYVGDGPTAEDAITEYARLNNYRLWNEEPQP